MKTVNKLLLCGLCATAVANAADALNGSGLFSENRSITGWTKYIYSSTLNTSAYYGSIKGNINDDGDYTLEFWSNGRSGLDPWDIQAKHSITMTNGYAYTIKAGMYSYNELGAATRTVDMGIIDSDYESYMGASFRIVGGDYTEFESEPYKHCGATDSYATFYINGGTVPGGFAVPWVVVEKTPISCSTTGGSTGGSTGGTTGGSVGTTDPVEANGDRVGPVTQYGQLQAGTNSAGQGRIFGSCPEWNEKPVKVRGMSLFWSILDSETDGTALPYYTEAAITSMVKDMKIEIVRIAMGTGSQNWGVSGYAKDPTTQEAMIDRVVKAAIKNDIYVIIDWHSHTAHTETALAKSFFSKMARLYGKYNNVIFEIYNEPATTSATATDGGKGTLTSWSTVKTYANSVIPAIREYSDNLIIVGTPSWSANVSAAVSSPINDKNVAYTFHYYATSHSTSKEGADAATAIKAGLPVFVTEWGTCEYTGDGEINATANSGWQTWMDTYDLSAANWAAVTKSESCAAFTTKSQGYGSLSGVSGAYFTTSGNMVKGYLSKNPSTYKACSNAVSGTPVVTPASSSSTPIIVTPASSSSKTPVVTPTSSSSTPVIVTPASSSSTPIAVVPASSSSKAQVASKWTSTNARFESVSTRAVTLSDLTGEGKRAVSIDVGLTKGEKYTVLYDVYTDASGEIVLGTKITANGETIMTDAIDITKKKQTVAYTFTAKEDVVTVSIRSTDKKGDIYVENFDVKPGTVTTINKIASARRAAISVAGNILNVVAPNNAAVKVQMFDIMGNLVLSKAMVTTAGNSQISVESLPRGNYVVKVAGNNMAPSVTKVNIK